MRKSSCRASLAVAVAIGVCAAGIAQAQNQTYSPYVGQGRSRF